MAFDPSLPLREGMVSFLRSWGQLTDLTGQQIYGEVVPADRLFPFVKYGVPLTSPEDYGCVSAGRVRFILHAFSQGVDTDEVSKINRVLAKLDDFKLPIEGGYTLDLKWIRNTVVKDQDEPAAWHGLNWFEALVGEAAA